MKRTAATADFLTLLYNATFMPVHYFRGQELVFTLPGWSFPDGALSSYRNAAAMEGLLFDYFAVDELLYLGIVRNEDCGEDVVIGPVSLFPLTPAMIGNITDSYGLNPDMKLQAQAFFERTPTFSLHQFLSILSMIHYQLSGELRSVMDIYKPTKAKDAEEIGKVHSDTLMERKENENYHDTFYFEQEYYGLVEAGDVAGLDSFLKAIPPLREGSVGPDYVRQTKNIFVASITMYTRHAIAGGLDIETAYQLSDTYIQEMEKMTDADAVQMLNQSAVCDFTRRVAESKIPQGMSQEIFRCIQYISNHINQPLSVEQTAAALHMNRSTLSKKFKRELGFNISSYIMRRKLEEARSLLRYTDKTISEISEYLCFSTQAYFQNVFKKKYGTTPRSFRMSAARSVKATQSPRPSDQRD
ncbi:helix-turn-helix domain-containing protein [Lachnoclostridium sp. Marseille-P6806]|uniref:helix-turn-helix domain-containing protein n=1 Tax=Lachnoclostridium sp. Marseille-P6806 TaxID=2364793 RepID=UPI00103249AF|nr:helix-turn-helix domain-containing protein [Lachnoclostridium sp. Marseille-P6806]